MPPHYLHLGIPKHVMGYVSRFRVRARTRAEESTIWRSLSRRETAASKLDSWHDHNIMGCVDWLRTATVYTSRQQFARGETEKPLIPLSFPIHSLSRFS